MNKDDRHPFIDENNSISVGKCIQDIPQMTGSIQTNQTSTCQSEKEVLQKDSEVMFGELWKQPTHAQETDKLATPRD